MALPILNSLSGCKKDDPEPAKTTQTQITVKDASGSVQSKVTVYLFEEPVTEEAGTNPANAITSAVSNANGIADFDLSNVAGVAEGGTFYFTAFHELLDGYKVLGSVEVTIEPEETTSEDLVIVNRGYAHGFLPTTIASSLARSEYQRWRSTQVVACGDGLRVIADPSTNTLVEAVGFGMLLSAYIKDKNTFDGLHTFYNSKRTAQANNMMAWSVTCDEINDQGSATDGDVDVAFALIVASKHWGEEYLDAAKEIIELIQSKLILTCTVDGQSVKILGPGYSNTAWGGCGEMDIMYHTSAFFRVFAEVTGEDIWNQLANDTYITLNKGAHATTGLVPDWQTANGTPGPNGRAGHFGYDACRAPWRLTLDYLWNGNAQSEAWAKKIATWANTTGPANIVDGYELNGTPRGTNGLNSSFLGGFSVATMAHSQAVSDRFGTELSKLNDTYWFNLNTRCLYLFTLSGNFGNPLSDD